MTEDSPAITLYRLQACPFCERVVRLLQEYDLPYRSRFVEPMHSDRNVVKRESGARTVPVVVDETTGATMAESANIVEYLQTTYGEEGGTLADPGTAVHADGGKMNGPGETDESGDVGDRPEGS